MIRIPGQLAKFPPIKRTTSSLFLLHHLLVFLSPFSLFFPIPFKSKPTKKAKNSVVRTAYDHLPNKIHRMYRIHPTESKIDVGELATTSNSPSVWTVWKKSTMAFPGTDGFSVYDSNGRLAFRVDNYSRRHKCFTGEVLLMDGNGRALMAPRPQVGHGNHVILASHMLYSDCITRQRKGDEV